jgi:phospholipid/cholesterol/gamma-HCH transport system substrate-binding protein
MATAIRKSLRDFIAVMFLILVAAVTSYVLLQEQRLRIPILEERPFELKAEFETAQAVVPGQGQTLRVAGVRVGDVQKTELEDGVGIVTFAVDREFLPIYRDATILMRPTTGLKDMFFDMDPGSRAAGEFEEGDAVPLANTAPDVNLDEILQALDGDTQAYLRLLLVGAGQGLRGRDRDLGELLGGLGPINRDFRALNVEVAKRDDELARLVHNLGSLTHRIGQADDDVLSFITSSNAALGAINSPELADGSVRRAVRLLGPTLSEARVAFTETGRLADVLGPTFEELRPFARNLDDMNASLERLGEAGTPVLRNQIRPFARTAQEPLPDLRRAAGRFTRATPPLTVVTHELNRVLNLAAYNPNGAEDPGVPGRDEGYLYWIAWVAHLNNLIFPTQDAHGTFRRVYFTATCNTIQSLVADDPSGGLVSGLIQLVLPGAVCEP